MLPQQRVGVTLGSDEPEAFVETDRLATVLPAKPIDRTACGYLPQPEHQVLVRIERADAVVELQKDLLRQIFGQCSVRQHAQRNAENARLVQSDERRKSVALASARGGKQLIRHAWLDLWQ